MADRRSRRPVNRRRRTRRTRTRRKGPLLRAWLAVHHALQKAWVRSLASLALLTLWLKLTAQDFNVSEWKAIGAQAMSVLVLALAGMKDKR